MLVFCKREHSALFLQSYWIAQPRAEGLPTYEPWLIPTRKWLCHFCRQRTKFAALRSPFLSRTGNVLHAFYLQSFCVLSFYTKTFRFTFAPAICKDCTVPRIQHGFLPTYEPWLIQTCESSDSHRQQTTFAAFRYVLRSAILFFRAKRGIRGCFGVKNPIRNCIWKYVRNGFSALKLDVDPISPCNFFESGWDTEVVSW